VSSIAYLGGGRMAQAMCDRLLQAGHSITMYNRTPSKLADLAARGVRVEATPAAAVAGATVVFSSVTNDDASRAVWTGVDGAFTGDMPAGTIVVEHSTMSYDWVLELAERAAERGLRYVDCPVAGRPDAAAAGDLIVFGGAAEADLEAVRPMLEPISREIFRFGPPGSGTAFKLIYNLMGVSQIVALAEGLAAAERAGIDLTTAATAFAHGNTGSGHVIKHGPFMAEGIHEDPPGFTPAGRVKDSGYGVELEERLGITPRVGRAALETYQLMVADGLADVADSRLIDFVRTAGRAD
jgi:3-hydroxyisobutyrate dehydrogenase